MGLAVASVALIPLGVLYSAARDRSLRRRSRFGLRLSAFVISVCLPELIVGVGSASGLIRSEPVAPLLLGLFWGLMVVVMAPIFLFYGHDSDPGQGDEGGYGPHPGEDPPSPTPPIGGLPLLDAEQSRQRLRGPRPATGKLRTRRRHHEPTRMPTRVGGRAQPGSLPSSRRPASASRGSTGARGDVPSCRRNASGASGSAPGPVSR
jgi:hypothetical protein